MGYRKKSTKLQSEIDGSDKLDPYNPYLDSD